MNKVYGGGELVVKVLQEFGAKRVFGVPGGQTLYVTDPLNDTDIRFVHTRHENGAACAADGWGRLTGEPGICLATTGPGATNLITGLGGALRDSSPVIALVRTSCQMPEREMRKKAITNYYLKVFVRNIFR